MKAVDKRRLHLKIVISVLAISSFACSSEEATMPELFGMREDEASEALTENGIDDWTVEWHEGENPSVVVNQKPKPGLPVEQETEVLIILSGK